MAISHGRRVTTSLSLSVLHIIRYQLHFLAGYASRFTIHVVSSSVSAHREERHGDGDGDQDDDDPFQHFHPAGRWVKEKTASV